MAVLIFLTTAGFLNSPRSPGDPYAYPLSSNPFAFTLLHAVLEQDNGKSNKLISPLSIYLSICLLYNGAGEATRDSLAEVLQVSGMDIRTLNGLCKNMFQEIHLEDNKVHLSFANSIWCNRKRLSLLPSFETTADTYYYTTTQSLNFGVTSAVERINGWVYQNTAHQVTSIVSGAHPKDLLYLINTAYLNSDWLYPFDAGESYKDLFYLAGGLTKTAPFMKKEFVTKVFSDTSFTMLELPYGKGKSFSMYVLLPDDVEQPLTEFAAGLTEERLSTVLSRMNDQCIQLSLPSWEYSYSMDDMKAAFSRMGMGILFNRGGNADFSGMAQSITGRPLLSSVSHHTCINVNEAGTRWWVSTAETPAPPEKGRRHRPLVLKADHPFLYLILEKQQHILLFAGTLDDPTVH